MNQQSSIQERRAHFRHDLVTDCTIFFGELLQMRGKIKNISRGGALIELTHAFPKTYFSLPMKLHFQAQHDGYSHDIETYCQVVRYTGTSIGVMFDNMQIKMVHVLIDSIEAKREHDK